MTIVLSLYKGLIEVCPPKTTMRDVIALVAERRGLTPADITGPHRAHKFVVARQEAMSLCCDLKRFSYPQMGRAFARDHSTIIHGVKAHRARHAALLREMAA